MRNAVGVLFLSALLGVLTTACRSLEQAGGDLDKGFRDTQQDIQHGIRGEPEHTPPPPSASTAQPRPSAPPPAPAAPAPTASGVSL